KQPGGRGTWRGVVDLSPAVAGMLGVSSLEPVRIIYMKRGKPSACKRACLNRAVGPRVKRHAERRPSLRGRAVEQPLVSSRSPGRGGDGGVSLEPPAAADTDDAARRLGLGAAGRGGALLFESVDGARGDGARLAALSRDAAGRRSQPAARAAERADDRRAALHA